MIFFLYRKSTKYSTLIEKELDEDIMHLHYPGHAKFNREMEHSQPI